MTDALAAISPRPDLPALILRAKTLLDDGDLIAAKSLAAAARSEAKHGETLAKKKGASDQLIAKARRLQGDALLIEVHSQIAIANEVDAAQQAGLLAKQGQRSNVSNGNVSTLDDVGLSRKEVHQARRLRDAEQETPGLAGRAIQARIEAGFSPSTQAIHRSIGVRSHTKEERGLDFYRSPPEAIWALQDLEKFQSVVWEPCCGDGAIAKPMEQAGHTVLLSDIEDRDCVDQFGECQKVEDFLKIDQNWMFREWGRHADEVDIITNPPFGSDVLNPLVRHALTEFRPRKLALLLNLNAQCGTQNEDRNFWMDEWPPSRILVFARRLPMMHRDGWDGPRSSSQMNAAWYIWDRLPDDASDARTDDLVRAFKGRIDPDGYENHVKKFPYGQRTQTIRVDWKNHIAAADEIEEEK